MLLTLPIYNGGDEGRWIQRTFDGKNAAIDGIVTSDWLLTPVPTSGHTVLLVLWPFYSRPLGPILPVS